MGARKLDLKTRHAGPHGLPRKSEDHEFEYLTQSIPDWIWAPFVSGFLLFISGGVGILLGQPWLFPSLGPSALLHAYHPANPAARLYNTVAGHFLGIAAGYLAVLIFHASTVPAVLSTEQLTLPRLGAAVLAMFLTIGSQILLKAFHPPAAATTLLIALGAFKPGRRELEVLVIGILIVAAIGEFFRRLRLATRPVTPPRLLDQ